MEEIAQIGQERAKNKVPGRLISREFFEDSPESGLTQAPRQAAGGANSTRSVLAGRIVEVEAYLGPHNDPPDPAAHTHRGPTPRNLVLFGPPGYAYLYSIYGKYFCANVSCEREGLGAGILLRALEPVLGIAEMARNRGLDEDAPMRMITSGPSRLCLALGLTRPLHNGLDVTSAASPLQVRDDGFPEPEVLITPRIGITACGGLAAAVCVART